MAPHPVLDKTRGHGIIKYNEGAVAQTVALVIN